MENISLYVVEYGLMVAGLLFTCATIIISETGKIFFANMFFLAGDAIYLLYAVVVQNLFGTIALTIAIIFSVRTLIKMNKGIYSKSLLAIFNKKLKEQK